MSQGGDPSTGANSVQGSDDGPDPAASTSLADQLRSRRQQAANLLQQRRLQRNEARDAAERDRIEAAVREFYGLRGGELHLEGRVMRIANHSFKVEGFGGKPVRLMFHGLRFSNPVMLERVLRFSPNAGANWYWLRRMVTRLVVSLAAAALLLLAARRYGTWMGVLVAIPTISALVVAIRSALRLLFTR